MKTREFKLSLYLLLFTMSVMFFSCDKESKQTDGNLKSDKSAESTEGNSTGEESVKNEQLGENVKINYNLIGVISGSMSVARSGNMLKQIVSTEVLGVNSSNVVYILNDTVYSISQAGVKLVGQKIKFGEFKKGSQTGETIVDPKELEKFLETKSVIGTENILGYQCDIFETGPDMSISVYDSKYVLRILIPQFQAVAVKLDLNPSFPGDEFIVPDNIDFSNDYSKKPSKEEMESMLKNLK